MNELPSSSCRPIPFASSVLAGALLALAGCAGPPRAQSLADGQSRFAMLGADRIHYVTVGQGPRDIVFVHCWAGNLGLWREQVPALSDKARLVLVDLPGHGGSDKPHTAYTHEYFAKAVLAVMQDAHVDKAVLVGHSMGAPVICNVYRQAPDKVAALVSVDMFLRRAGMMDPAQAGAFMARFEAPDYRANVQQVMGQLFPVAGTEALRDEVIAALLQTPQYVMVGAMHGMFDADQPDWDLGRVTVPVIAINARDPKWNAADQEYVRSLSPRTDYRLIDHCGHWLMLEKPAEFNATLVAALRGFDLIAK
jgi:pimeloyl-ACP methyl ester carboxylesterase